MNHQLLILIGFLLESARGDFILTKQEPIFVLNGDDFFKAYNKNKQLSINCDDCLIKFNFAAHCARLMDPKTYDYNQNCTFTESPLIINGKEMDLGICETSQNQFTLDFFMSCEMDLKDSIKIYWDLGRNKEVNDQYGPSSALSFRVSQWMEDGSKYWLVPFDRYRESIIMSLDGSLNTTWIIFSTGNMQTQLNHLGADTPSQTTCKYDVIYGPPPGKSSAYENRLIFTGSDVMPIQFQYLENNLHSIRSPAQCSPEIQVEKVEPDEWNDKILPFCRYDYVVMNQGFKRSQIITDDYYLSYTFECSQSNTNLIIEIVELLSGWLKIEYLNESYRTIENSTVEIPGPLDSQCRCIYAAFGVKRLVISWKHGDRDSEYVDGIFARVHLDISDEKTKPKVLPANCTLAAPATTTTKRQSIGHSTTTKMSNIARLSYVYFMIFIVWFK